MRIQHRLVAFTAFFDLFSDGRTLGSQAHAVGALMSGSAASKCTACGFILGKGSSSRRKLHSKPNASSPFQMFHVQESPVIHCSRTDSMGRYPAER